MNNHERGKADEQRSGARTESKYIYIFSIALAIRPFSPGVALLALVIYTRYLRDLGKKNKYLQQNKYCVHCFSFLHLGAKAQVI